MTYASTRIGFISLLIATAGLSLTGCAQNPPAETPVLASQPTTGQEVGAVARNKIEVTFPVGSYRLSPDANNQLDLAARLFRDVNPIEMFSMGYADMRGNELSNILLSARRASAVKQGLVARGIPPDRVLIQAFGESDPATKDPSAPANRRVIVQWRLI